MIDDLRVEPPPPTLPERFEDVRWIGSGAQAKTVVALDTEAGCRVVIKLFDLRAADDWKAYERFERECAVLASLDHPGVPRYREHLRDDDHGRSMLIMDLVEGQTLAHDIRTGRRRTEAQLLALLTGLLDVLEYLHGLHPPVIHRDIKPSNVVVRPDGTPVLVDFGGVAKVFAPDGAATVVGTFGYMAPEQLYGRVTPGADLYALGATLAAVAAGEQAERLPREGLEVDLSQAIPPGLVRDVLGALLTAEPDRRPASVAAVRPWLTHTGPRAAGEDLDDRVKARRPAPSAAALPSGEHAIARRPRDAPLQRASVRGMWGRLSTGQRAAAIGYLWAAVGMGVVTRALVLSLFMLMLFPLVLGLIHGLGSRE